MANINTSYRNADRVGRPAFESLDTYVPSALLAGAEPGIQPPIRLLMGDNLSLAQFQVVGRDVNKKLVPLTYAGLIANDATKIVPVGIMAHAAVSGANNTTQFGNVIYTGCFATEGALIWDASFDTDAKKEEAFIGAPTPTQIVVRRRLATTA